MSDREPDDIDTYRIKTRGSERFSDRCSKCKHSRASHLPTTQMNPTGGGRCRKMMCKEQLVPKVLNKEGFMIGLGHFRHSKLCKLFACDCEWNVK